MTTDSRDDDTLEAPTEAVEGDLLFGRYQLLEELGRGGMGKVLRVLDTKIHEEIAVKLIHPEVASRPGVLARFRNELKLARKVAHPNVCRVFDLGEHEGTPFITMELVPGEDLGRVLEKYAPLPVDRTLEIASGICRGLAEAHRLGVVHRDLKPRNIQIDPGGEPHIMDFGLARSPEVDGHTVVGTMMGTPHYMSPEQVDGIEADQKADIYSLGVVLFEMVVGSRPFEGDSALAIAVQHKATPPPSASERNPAVPEELAAILLRCMAKDPDERFESAEDLLAALTGEADPASTKPKAGEPVAEPPSIVAELLAGSSTLIEESMFANRESQLEWLDSRFDRALEGNGQVAFVTGSPGSGKTELTARFVELALARIPELLVVGGKCNAQTGAESPFLPFRQTLELLTGDIETRWALGRIGADQAMRLWRAAPAGVAALVEEGPILTGTLVNTSRLLRRAQAAGVAGPALAAVERLVAASSADLSAHEHEIHEQFGRVLFRLSEETPLIVVLDDLHWIDQGSASLLAHLAGQLEGRRIMMVGTFRPDEIRLTGGGEKHPLEGVVHELTSRLGDLSVELDSVADRTFLDAFLDSQPNQLDADFRAALLEHTKGHALFTVELLRDLQERGVLVEVFAPMSGEVVELDGEEPARGVWQVAGKVDWDALPARTEGVIAERLGRLSDDLREMLVWASVEGEEFTAEVLARVLDRDARSVARTLSRELDKSHGLVRAQSVRRSGGSRLSLYRFRHVLFQKFLYSELDDVEVSFRHEDVGNAMEEIYAADRDELAVQLGRHFALAGMEEKAFEYSKIAGERALRLSAFTESIPQFQKSLEMLDQLPPTDERNRDELQLLLALATALTATAGYSAREVEEVCNRARKVVESSQGLAENFGLLCRLWSVHFVRADAEASPELARQLETMAEREGDPVKQAIAAWVRGVSLFWAGPQVEAGELLEKAVEAYDTEGQPERSLIFGLGDPLFTARNYRSWNLALLGRTGEAWANQEQVLAEAEALGEPFAHVMALCFATALSEEIGRPVPAAQELITRADELCREHELIAWVPTTTLHVGWCQAQMGDEAGIGRIQEALAFLQATGGALAKPVYYLKLAEALLAHRREDEALEAIAMSLETSSSNLEKVFDAEAYRLRGLIEQDDDEAAAEASFQRALEIASEDGALLFQLKAAVALARLHRSQRGDDASLDLLESVVEKLADEDLVYLKHARRILAEAGGAVTEENG